MLDNEKIIAFLATAEAPAARAFYEGQLGLQLKYEDDFAIVYEVQGTELRIQKTQSVHPQSLTALGWSVASIEETVRTLSKAGVRFMQFNGMEQSERGIWTSPSGAKVAWFKDPDGHMLSLTESLAGRG